MKTIYITGSNGFIGGRILQYFSSKSGYNVFGIQRGYNKVVDNIIYCDYQDIKYLQNIVVPDCVVIHTAAFIPDTYQDNINTLVINSQITEFITKVFKMKNVTSFFHLSSISVYGYGVKDLVNICEDSEIILSNYYAKAKYKNEILLTNNFDRNYNLRISSPFGFKKKQQTLLDLLIKGILNNKEITIYGKGERKQDYIWVQDIARVVNKMIELNPISGDYNLSTGNSLSVKEVILILEKITKQKANIVSVNKIEAPSTYISNSKLLKAISNGCFFFTPFEQAIKECINNEF